MQNGQGYCTFCHVLYNNLEEHMFSAHHRNMATAKRYRMGSNSLMERFLQDVLRHHPYQRQDDRSTYNERRPKNTVFPEVAGFEDFIPEEIVNNMAEVRGDIPSKSFGTVEELYSRPSRPQEYVKDISVRPSVIQKLEKGQQHALEFVHEIGNNMKEFNPVDIDQATNNGQNLRCIPVISSVPASCLSESFCDRPVMSNTVRLPPVAHLDSVNKCDLNKADSYLQRLGNNTSNPTLSAHLETSSVAYSKSEESTMKSLSINSSKLILQNDVKSQDQTLSADCKFMDIEGSLRLESLSTLAQNSAANLDKINVSSNKGIFEDAIPKNHTELFSNMDHTQEEKHLFFENSPFLEQKSSVYSEMKSDRGCLQSVSDQHQEAAQDLTPWKEERVDLEDKNCESRGSEMSFDCSSSFFSLPEQSRVTAKEIKVPVEVHADLQYKNNELCVSEISSDCDSSLPLVNSQSQVTDKEISLQKTTHVSLVDQSYESDSSETDFHCDTSRQPIIVYPQQSVKDINLPMKVRGGLVDESYGSSGSEVSADSALSFQAVVDWLPVAVKKMKLEKKVHVGLVDKNYESSSSETSFDDESSHQSVVDHCQLSLKGRNLKDRHVDLEDKNCKPSSVKACPDYDVTLETVTDEQKRTVEEINILRENSADLMDENCESPDDTPSIADQSEESSEESDSDLEKKSDESSVSDLSFDSHASPRRSANDQSQGALNEMNLKDLNIDMEVKSYDCTSSELTFESDPILPANQESRIDFEEIRRRNMRDKNYESSGSEITFDSDIFIHSVVDQPKVTVYEEVSVDLGNKNDESSVSEITFDSDSSLHSDTEESDVAVEEISVQEEEQVPFLERKSDGSTDSEISLDSDSPLHSVTNPIDVAVKKLNLQNEEQLHLENKGDETNGLELSLDYDATLHSVSDCSEVSVDGQNFQKDEDAYFQTEADRPALSDTSLKSDTHLNLITDHPDIAAKEINHQKEEHVHLKNKSNEFTVSDTGFDSDIPLQSVTYQPEVVAEEIHLQNKKYTDLEDKSVEPSGSEIILDSEIPCYLVTEPQIPVKKIDTQKEEQVVLENKSDECSGSEIVLNSDISHYIVTEPSICVTSIDIQKEEHTVLENKNDECTGSEIVLHSDVSPQSPAPQLHVDPEDESTESRGFEISLGIDAPHSFITDQPQLGLVKEECVDLEHKSSESSGSKINVVSDEALQLLTGHIQETVKRENLWKEEDIGPQNKADEPNSSKSTQDSEMSLQAVASQPEVVVKQVNPEKEEHVYMEDKNSQYSGSEMSLDSDFVLQSITNQPQMTILEQEHIGLEDKHGQSCGSEISFDSDDPLQSVADQLQKAVKEISLWEDEEVDMEEKRDKSGGCEIRYNSDVLPSVTGQTEEVLKEINLWKQHVEMEDEIVKSSGSKINCDSDKPLQPVAYEMEETVKDTNILREENVYLDDKGYELSGSEVIYASNVPVHTGTEQLEILEQEHANLEDKSNDSCGPEISFDPDDPIQSVDDQLQKAVKEISLWKEDRVYLEDKSYKLGDFEVIYNSDVSRQLLANQSPVTVKEIRYQRKKHNDLEHKNYKHSASEIKFGSGVHFQTDVDQPRVTSKERHIQKEKHLDMEEQTNEPGDSEMICVSDVPLQIVVNQSQAPVKETDLHKVVLLDLVTSDSDCEIVSDSVVRFQSVTDPPQMTVKEVNCVNTDCIDLEDESCDSCGSEISYVCEGPPESTTNQSKGIFKLVNQKGDYIILEDLSCDPCGSEIDFSGHQSMAYESQGPEKKMKKYIDKEDKTCESSGHKSNFIWEDSSQSVTDQLQKATKEGNLRKHLRDSRLKNKNCESSTSAEDYDTASESVIQDVADKEDTLKLKHTDLESVSCEPCGLEMDLQYDPSLQCNSDQPKEAVSNTDLFEDMSFDVKDNHDPLSSCVFMVNPLSNLEKAKGTTEDTPDEPVLEALPHVPPSFVGKTWSQIMREDDVKINALVKEFKEGRFHCYFDDDCETGTIKKSGLNEGKNITWTDLNQKPASVQVLSDGDDTADGDVDIDDFSVALDKPSLRSQAERPYKQKWHLASRCQTVKVSHGTQTNLISSPVKKRKIIRQEEDSPKRKSLNLQNDKVTKKIKIGTVEFPESCTEVLKPLQPNALVYVLSSPNVKLKEDESLNCSKTGQNSWDNIQYKYKQSSYRYYDPLTKQIVIDPPNTVVPESDSDNWVKIHLNRSDLECSAPDEDAHVQSSASSSFMAVPVRYQSGSTCAGMHLKKKKSDVRKLKKVKRPAQILLNPSAPSADTAEQSGAIASSASKQPVQDSPCVAGKKTNGNKNRLTTQKPPSEPVKMYALRSLSCQPPQSDRVRTRLSNKLSGNKVN